LFKLLKAQEKFVWSKDTDKAFAELKRFLTTPPVTTAPEKDETLLIYIVVTNRVVSTPLLLNKSRMDTHTKSSTQSTSSVKS